jgi:hypothetical protein
MANNSKRISELGVPTTLAANDRIVVLTGPDTAIANVQSITVTNFGAVMSNSMPIANSTHLGVVSDGADGVGIQTNDGGLYVKLANTVPTTSLFAGRQGSMRVDANYLYVCVSLNKWKRVPLDDTF